MVPQWIIQLVFGLLISGNLWWTKRHIATQDKTDEAQDERIDALTQELKRANLELQAYKLEVSEKYVSKDEFVRATAHTDRKLDRIYDEIIKLTAKQNA